MPQQRGLVPTDRALALGHDLAPLLRTLDATLSAGAFDPASAKAQVRILATDYAVCVVLLPLLKRLRTLAPGLDLVVFPTGAQPLGDRLETGEVDLALTVSESAPRTARSRRLLKDGYILAAASNHADLADLGTRRALDLDRACALDYVLVSPQGGGLVGAADAALGEIGRKRRVVASVPGFMAAIELVARTSLVTLLPKRMISLAKSAGAATFEFPLTIPEFELIAVWHERAHSDPMHIWLRDQLYREIKPK